MQFHTQVQILRYQMPHILRHLYLYSALSMLSRANNATRRPNRPLFATKFMTGVSGAETERSGPKLGWSGAERWAGLRKIGRSGAWAGGRGAGTERWVEVRQIRFNTEWQNRPLRSAHMLCKWVAIWDQFLIPSLRPALCPASVPGLYIARSRRRSRSVPAPIAVSPVLVRVRLGQMSC